MCNGAYKRIILKGLFKEIKSAFAAGDDGVDNVDSRAMARRILNAMVNSKVGFNPHKQSWGPSREFLRHSVLGANSYGYLNRALATFVCGSWVNKKKLAETDLFSIFHRMCWTCDNRGLNMTVAKSLFSSSLSKRTGVTIEMARQVCGHTIAVNSGPVISDCSTAVIIFPRTKVIQAQMPTHCKSYATDSYLDSQKHILNTTLSGAEFGHLRQCFKKASYKKGLTIGYEPQGYLYVVKKVANIYSNIDMCMVSNAHKGVLSMHPTLPSMKDELTINELRSLTKFATGRDYTGHGSVKQFLFGRDGTAVACPIGHSFDDMCQAGGLDFLSLTNTIAKICLARRCYH
jgi:hypothetical protein